MQPNHEPHNFRQPNFNLSGQLPQHQAKLIDPGALIGTIFKAWIWWCPTRMSELLVIPPKLKRVSTPSELPRRSHYQNHITDIRDGSCWQDNLCRLSLSDSHFHVISRKFQQLNLTTFRFKQLLWILVESYGLLVLPSVDHHSLTTSDTYGISLWIEIFMEGNKHTHMCIYTRNYVEYI